MSGIRLPPSAWSPQITANLSAPFVVDGRIRLRIELRDYSRHKQALQPAVWPNLPAFCGQQAVGGRPTGCRRLVGRPRARVRLGRLYATGRGQRPARVSEDHREPPHSQRPRDRGGQGRPDRGTVGDSQPQQQLSGGEDRPVARWSAGSAAAPGASVPGEIAAPARSHRRLIFDSARARTMVGVVAYCRTGLTSRCLAFRWFRRPRR
jgi:hypothetical protein